MDTPTEPLTTWTKDGLRLRLLNGELAVWNYTDEQWELLHVRNPQEVFDYVKKNGKLGPLLESL